MGSRALRLFAQPGLRQEVMLPEREGEGHPDGDEEDADRKANGPFRREPQEDEDGHGETEDDDVQHDRQYDEPALEGLSGCLIHHSYLNAVVKVLVVSTKEWVR